MRALVTGISGFVGGHLTEHLVGAGDLVVGISATGRWPAELAHLGRLARIERVDLIESGEAELAELLGRKQPEVIYHLAAQSNPQQSVSDPRGTLALIVLLDQFSRNLHRNLPEAFAADAKVREIARAAIARGVDQRLGPVERMFMYLPFEHSEELSDQDEAVRLLTTLGEEMVRYAEDHRDVIRRFGRFPHRNAALGRVSTPEELDYLAQPDAGF